MKKDNQKKLVKFWNKLNCKEKKSICFWLLNILRPKDNGIVIQMIIHDENLGKN